MNSKNKNIFDYSKIKSAKDLEEIVSSIFCSEDLDKEQKKYKILGRNGLIQEFFDNFSYIQNILNIERSDLGIILNRIKSEYTEKLKDEIQDTRNNTNNTFDPTLEYKNQLIGGKHPLSVEVSKINEIMISLGFSEEEYPTLVTDFENFESINIPKEHPARDMWDTFWIDEKHLLKTQTTAFQNSILSRELKKGNDFKPIRAFTTDVCLRNEATDTRHEICFYQTEALYVEHNNSVNMVILLNLIRSVFSLYFDNSNIKVKTRPAFFPFVEPGIEVACECIFCGGKGCNTCSQSGWIEMGGAGLVHRNVFMNADESLKDKYSEYSGLAFGFGFDRMVLLKNKINDIRYFRNKDINIDLFKNTVK